MIWKLSFRNITASKTSGGDILLQTLGNAVYFGQIKKWGLPCNVEC